MLSRRNSCRRSRRTRSVTTQNLERTIDLTNDDYIDHMLPNSSANSSSWEIIDLSTEGDDESVLPVIDEESPASYQTTSLNQKDEDDFLPPVPFLSFHEKSKKTFKCPICFIDLAEAEGVLTTRCGHVFCKACLTSSLSMKSACPMCRRRTLKTQIITLHLYHE